MNAKIIKAALIGAALILGLSAMGPLPDSSSAQQRTASAIGHYFGETGHSVSGGFWQHWNATGGLARHGYPISPTMNEKSDADGKTYVVQYFERSVFQSRPDKRLQNDTLTLDIGTMIYKQRYPRGAANQKPNTSRGSVLVRSTGKRIGGALLEFYSRNDGANAFGNPLTDEITERNILNGTTSTVQYFERAALQIQGSQNKVASALLGRSRYDVLYAKLSSNLEDMDNDNIPNTDANGDGLVEDFCPRYPENVNKVFDTDGCPDTIETLLTFAAEDINEYWKDVFERSGIRYREPLDLLPYTRPVQTPCGAALLNNAFYCPPSHGIYYDFNFLFDQLDSDGDFAPVTILAHEWGHLVQGNLGNLSGQFFTIQTELQADCYAGAWAKHAGDRGLLEEGDLEEGAVSLFKAGDDSDLPWFDEGAHGQPDQRVEAYNIGFDQGAEACTLDN